MQNDGNKRLQEIAENRASENVILAASIEKSTEFENLLEGTMNSESSKAELEDDPMILAEDLKSRASSSEEDDTVIISEGELGDK